MKKRIVSLILAAVLFCSLAFPSAAAAEEEILFGDILVQGVSDASPKTYRGARDAEDVVYIHAEDFAAIAGGSISNYLTREQFRYDLGFWRILVDTAGKQAEVYFDPADKYLGYALYGDFALTDCLYQEEEEAWYFPFEQMLYLSHAQWMCDEMTVFVYRPETVLDLLQDLDAAAGNLPNYADVMGDGAWEQVGNQFKYGFQAAVDDMDMTFIADSIWTSFALKDSTTYEENVLKAALLLLRSDSPEDDSYTTTAEGFQAASDFVSGVSTALDLSSKDGAFAVVQDLLGLTMTQSQLASISDKVGVGGNLVNYALGVGQALWARDYMPESFGKRLQLIEKVASADPNSNFCRRLADAAEESYRLYVGDVTEAYTQHIKLNDIFSLIDGIGNIAGVDLGANDLAITPLRWANLTVTVFDTGVEVMKVNFPGLQSTLEEAEDIHLCLDLVKLSAVMQQEYRDSLLILRQADRTLTQEDLDAIRLTAQISQCAGMHAHETLIRLGNMPDAALGEQVMLQRLSQSEKYDALLLLDTAWRNIHTTETGCVRMVIPPEYVQAGCWPFLHPLTRTDTVPEGFVGIYDRDDLLSLADDPTGSYILMEDIRLDAWDPLPAFSGILEGNGHTLSHMEISCSLAAEPNSAKNWAHPGFFTAVSGGTVRNLIISGSITVSFPAATDYGGGADIGGIASRVTDGAEIFNCVSAVNIRTTETASSFFHINPCGTGGITGFLEFWEGEETMIQYCRYMGTIEAYCSAGGIVGTVDPTSGATGIYACQNDGTIKAESAGGIVGSVIVYGPATGIRIRSCVNTGTVTGWEDAGGILGFSYGDGDSANVEDCLNLNTVTALNSRSYAGGIVGSGQGTFVRCVNAGIVDGNPQGGAVAGRLYQGASAIENCYSLDVIPESFIYSGFSTTAQKQPHVAILLSKDAMRLPESYGALDLQALWMLEEGMPYPYPTVLYRTGYQAPGKE